MRITTLGFFLFCFTGTCFGQAGEALCPRHIETPVYPSIARIANVTGKVTLPVAIDADGKVGDVKATTTESNVPGSHLLEAMTVTTFANPPWRHTNRQLCTSMKSMSLFPWMAQPRSLSICRSA
jgi:Gram-negative bacterial TonB protein C-terminal